MRVPAWRARPQGWDATPLPFFDPQSAGRGPFLDAGEIVVCAVAVRPHRQIQRSIGLTFVLEGADQRLQLPSRLIGGSIRRLRLIALVDLQLQRLLFARRVVAAKPDIAEFADGSVCRNAVKAAFSQDRCLQRELRRQSHAHLFAGRRWPGLVVEDRKRPVVTAFDAIGAGGQMEDALVVERNRDFTSDFGFDASDVAAPGGLPLRKPGGDALEWGPPQRPRFRPLPQRREIFLPNAAQGARGIVRQLYAESLGEFAECVVDRRPA